MKCHKFQGYKSGKNAGIIWHTTIEYEIQKMVIKLLAQNCQNGYKIYLFLVRCAEKYSRYKTYPLD